MTKKNNKNYIFTAFLILPASSAFFLLPSSAREFSHVSPLSLTWYFTFSAEKRREEKCAVNGYLML